MGSQVSKGKRSISSEAKSNGPFPPLERGRRANRAGRPRPQGDGARVIALVSSQPGALMPEIFVAKASDLPDGERRIVAHGDEEIGVFHWQGAFYAYQNLCVHQGGPACEGIIMH